MKGEETQNKTLPLAGRRILVTRAPGQAGLLAAALARRGAEPLEVPVLHFGEPSSWEPLDRCLEQIGSYDWAVFVSTNAVTAVLDRAEATGIDLRGASANLKIAAIGRSTAKELEKRGLPVHFTPSRFVAEAFVAEFEAGRVDGLKILWPRTNTGRTLIADQLGRAGATVDMVEAYTTALPPDPDSRARELEQLLAGGAISIVTLASSQTVKNFAALLCHGKPPGFHPAKLLTETKIAVIGPITAEAARKTLGRVDIEADEYTVDGLVEAICKSEMDL